MFDGLVKIVDILMNTIYNNKKNCTKYSLSNLNDIFQALNLLRKMNITNHNQQTIPSVLKAQTKDESTGSRRTTNRYKKLCRLTMMALVWVAACVPSNIIGVIFFFKNQSSENSQLAEIPAFHIDKLEGYKEMSSEKKSNLSTELSDLVS